MEITIACPCGAKFTRNEGSAGARFKCACGQDLQVPALAELRRMSGEPEDPERLIRAGLDERELFPDGACCRCQVRTEAWVPVLIECEPGCTEGGFDWRAVLLALAMSCILLPIGFILLVRSWRPQTGHAGKGYRVPLLVCPECQKRLDRETLIQCVRSVPVYDRLLNKYPEANVYVIARQG